MIVHFIRGSDGTENSGCSAHSFASYLGEFSVVCVVRSPELVWKQGLAICELTTRERLAKSVGSTEESVRHLEGTVRIQNPRAWVFPSES